MNTPWRQCGKSKRKNNKDAPQNEPDWEDGNAQADLGEQEKQESEQTGDERDERKSGDGGAKDEQTNESETPET